MIHTGDTNSVKSNGDARQKLLGFDVKKRNILSFTVSFSNWKLRAALVVIICIYFLYVCMTTETLRKLNNEMHTGRQGTFMKI